MSGAGEARGRSPRPAPLTLHQLPDIGADVRAAVAAVSMTNPLP